MTFLFVLLALIWKYEKEAMKESSKDEQPIVEFLKKDVEKSIRMIK